MLVNFNGLRFMPECIESLREVDYPNLHIVIVDNASKDGSREWIEELSDPFEKLLLDTNTGITGGNNAGIEACIRSRCDHVLLLNNDTIVNADLVGNLVSAASSEFLLVPKIYFHADPKRINTNFGDFDFVRGLNLNRFYNQLDTAESERETTGTMASTCALMIPVEVFDKVGRMDENYFIYYDDTDFVARAVKHGYMVKYVPSAILYHKESSSSGGERLGPLPLYYLTRNRLYFMSKHQRNRALLIAFWAYFIVGRCVFMFKCSLRGDLRSIKAVNAGIIDFIKKRQGYVPTSRFNSTIRGGV